MTPIIQMPSTSQPNCQRSFSRKLVRPQTLKLRAVRSELQRQTEPVPTCYSEGNRRFYLIVGCCQPQLNLDFKKDQIKRGTIPNQLESRLPYPWLLPASPCQWWIKVYAVSVNAQGQIGLFYKKNAKTFKTRFFPLDSGDKHSTLETTLWLSTDPLATVESLKRS